MSVSVGPEDSGDKMDSADIQSSELLLLTGSPMVKEEYGRCERAGTESDAALAG